MKMEVLKGTATGVRYTVHVSGGRDDVSTRHHAIFKLGQLTVVFDAGSPPVISEGDQLVVAGRVRGKVLLADAYLNQTALVRGDSGWRYNLAVMLFNLPLGTAGLALSLFWPLIIGGDIGWAVRGMVMLAGATFVALGSLSLYRWLRIRRAVKLLRGG
jgi:hypothetical protein